MNSFQIKDKDGNILTISQLDKEASAFWGNMYSTTKYASPTKYGQNWYDIIGWYIAYQGDYSRGWYNVITSIMSCTTEGIFYKKGLPIKISDNYLEELSNAFKFIEPYLALINHWDNLGYQPEQLSEDGTVLRD